MVNIWRQLANKKRNPLAIAKLPIYLSLILLSIIWTLQTAFATPQAFKNAAYGISTSDCEECHTTTDVKPATEITRSLPSERSEDFNISIGSGNYWWLTNTAGIPVERDQTKPLNSSNPSGVEHSSSITIPASLTGIKDSELTGDYCKVNAFSSTRIITCGEIILSFTNSPPKLTTSPLKLSTSANTALSLNLPSANSAGSDADGDPLKWVLTQVPARGSLNSALTTYTPQAGATGTVSFELALEDNDGARSSDRLSITVDVVGSAPRVTSATSFNIIRGRTTSLRFDLEDSEGDPINWQFFETNFPVQGSLSANSGIVASGEGTIEVEYTHNGNSADQVNLSLLLSDPSDSNNVPVKLNVVLPPDADDDSVADDIDNCPSVSNLDQSNIDGDTLGDICDPDRDGDDNFDGQLTIEARQNGRVGTIVVNGPSSEPITLLSNLSPNNFAISQGNWSASDPELLQVSSADGSRQEHLVLELDRNSVSPGIYRAQLSMSFDSDNVLAQAQVYLVVVDGNKVIDKPELVDADGDRLPMAADSVDNNANWLPLLSTSNNRMSSDAEMRVGRVASQHWAERGYDGGAGVTLSQSEFNTAFAKLYPSRTVSPLTGFASASGVLDYELLNSSKGETLSARAHLFSPMKNSPTAKVLSFSSNAWVDFDAGMGDRIASASSDNDSCPNNPDDYVNGLKAGDDCVLMSVRDGGLNDDSAAPDGEVRLTLNIGSISNDGNETNPIPPTQTPSSGGGGAAWWLLLVMAIFPCRRVLEGKMSFKYNTCSGLRYD